MQQFHSILDDASYDHPHNIQYGNVTGDLNACYSLDFAPNFVIKKSIIF